jgi:hypothetical protein
MVSRCPVAWRPQHSITVFHAVRVVSTADSGFQNYESSGCIDTLYEFGSEEQKQKYIPALCR